MSPTLAIALTGAVVALAAAIGILLRLLDGRQRGGGHLRFDTADAGVPLGPHVTLVQFSTELCARCPQVRRLLTNYAAEGDALQYIEIDVTHRPEVSARYKVLQTPTTFVIDNAGSVRARFHGVPHRQDLAEAIAAI